MTELTQQRACQLLGYCPDTGVVFWRTNHGQNKAEQTAGSRNSIKKPYLRLTIDRKPYLLHRVIWLMETGRWPTCIDHINGNISDNRWCNLRDVQPATNNRNCALSAANKSGIPGVWWKDDKQVWLAYIRHDNKQQHLYCGNDFFEACCARKSAERFYGFHENHGRQR